MKKNDAAARDSEPFLVIAETRPAKRRFRRRWLVVALLLALLAGGVLAAQIGLLPGRIKTTAAVAKLAGDTIQAVQGNSTDEAGMAENLAGLALQGISLFNGEKGAELWRLKASWAHLAQEGDTILVDAPVVRYTLGEPADNDYLDVKSEKGTITDSQRYLTLTGNVDVQHFGDTLTGPKLSYDSKTRVMVFPDGATLRSERATGRADVFTWDLGSSTMMGEGNVDVLIKPQTQTQPAMTEPAVLEPTGADATPAVAVPAMPVPAVAKPKTVTHQTPKAASTKTTSTKAAATTKKTATKTSTKKTATPKTGSTPAAPKTTAPKKTAPKKSTPKQPATPAKSTS